ncbi:MAG: hypothetical protein AB7I19_02870 [Planctomycetota bacterium]
MVQAPKRCVSLVVLGALSAAVTDASQAQTSQSESFAPPVLVQAGDTVLGKGRMYPSPMLHDVNGDGLVDVVVGDLPGRLTFALRVANDGAKVPTFAAEEKFLGADGKQLSFGNW